MLDDLKKHPSDIAKSAVKYLSELKVSDKTKRAHEDVLFFFVESLFEDSSAVKETRDGEYVLESSWDDYYGGVISNYMDYWLPKSVMDDEVAKNAPGVLRKWLKWCHEKGFFDKEQYKDFVSAVPKGKKKEITRLKKAGELLYSLHSPRAVQAGKLKSGKVVPLASKQKEPEAWDEGYMKILKLGETTAFLENEDGDKIGPVQLSRELVEVLKVEDVMNVSVGKFGKSWKVLESGNVYGEKEEGG